MCRLDAYTQDMLSLFQQLLGKDFWDFVVIVFTHVDEEVRDELDDAIEAVLDPSGDLLLMTLPFDIVF